MQQVDELKTVESGDGPKNGFESESSKVMFLPEQQAKVQELIDDAYKKAYAKAHRRNPSEEVEKLKAEVDKLKHERKAAALLRAVSRHSVVDAEEVVELLKDRVRVDDSGNLSVVGETGASRINHTGLPMSVEEYVGSWLSERPHHLRAPGGAGSGSSGSRFSANASLRYDLSDPAIWRNMPREELDRLLKEGISVQGSTGQSYKFRDVKNPFLEARKRKFQSGVSSNR
ncbi:MAG: hypothetical protein HY889_08215 [Deltaproteobacteria bacterium]|nr:hypothetical protein [Deltaproteobacteria bacterium]